MSEISEIHLLKQRLAELESTVDIIDKGQQRDVTKLRDKMACAFAASGAHPQDVYRLADHALKCRGES